MTDRGGWKPRLFFLLYISRSGSTFLADALTKHPDAAVVPEEEFAIRRLIEEAECKDIIIRGPEALVEMIESLYVDPKFLTWGVPKDALIRAINKSDFSPLRLSDLVMKMIHLSVSNRYGKGKLRAYGFKANLWYALHIAELRELFPQAKFIHIVRDGRAAYASAKKAVGSLTGEPLAKDPAKFAREWRLMNQSVRDFLSKPWLYEIKYEDLISEPISVLRRISEFLSIDSSEGLINGLIQPAHSAYVVAPQAHLHENVGKGPDISRIYGWKRELTRSELRIFEKFAGVELLGKEYHLMASSRAAVVCSRVLESGKRRAVRSASKLKRFLKP